MLSTVSTNKTANGFETLTQPLIRGEYFELSKGQFLIVWNRLGSFFDEGVVLGSKENNTLRLHKGAFGSVFAQRA